MTFSHVERLGEAGPRIVLVHGSLIGRAAWQEQHCLAARWRLAIPERHGYGDDAPERCVDYERDVQELIALLEDGAHLVGTSMGGVVSLRAAGRRPDLIRSLTVIEPPLFADHADDPLIGATMEDMQEAYRRGRDEQDLTFIRRFLAAIGADMTVPDPLPPPLALATATLRSERPWEVTAPLDDVAAAPFPKLVVSGGSTAPFERVCEALAPRLGAERAVLPGSPHAVQRIGAPFNDLLEDFLLRAEGRAAGEVRHAQA